MAYITPTRARIVLEQLQAREKLSNLADLPKTYGFDVTSRDTGLAGALTQIGVPLSELIDANLANEIAHKPASGHPKDGRTPAKTSYELDITTLSKIAKGFALDPRLTNEQTAAIG